MKSRHLIVSNLKKIIPINENLSQFKAHVSVQSNNEPFKAAIVSQTRLEEKGTIEYQDAVDGLIEYNITQENNARQMFYLVIVSNENIEVEVILEVSALARPPPTSTRVVASKSGGTNWLLVVLVIVSVSGIIWYFITQNNKPKLPPKLYDLGIQFTPPQQRQPLNVKIQTPLNNGGVNNTTAGDASLSTPPTLGSDPSNSIMEKINKYFEASPS